MYGPDKNDRLARLLQVWTNKRRGEDVPAHAELRPNELLFMLPDLCLMNVGRDGDFGFRLVGTGVADRLRRDPTGQGLDALPPATAGELRELCAATLDAGRPMSASGRLLLGEADRVVDALCLPFADAKGRVTVLLLGFQFQAWRDVAQLPPLGELEICDVDLPAAPTPGPRESLKMAC